MNREFLKDLLTTPAVSIWRRQEALLPGCIWVRRYRSGTEKTW